MGERKKSGSKGRKEQVGHATKRDPKRSPRLAIIGFGRMAEGWHVPGLKKAGWEIAGVLDITPARRKQAGALGLGRGCRSIDELLKIDFDAALVATHSAMRLEVIEPLVKAGKHLLIEKPLATTAYEAERICRLAERKGVLCSVYHNRRFDPDFLRVQGIVESGFIGKVVRVENRLFSSEPGTGFGTPEFRQKWRITGGLGGGTMLDWGPHMLDQVLTLAGAEAGPVARVFADVRNVRHGDADDHFFIELVFENGLRATVGKSDLCPIGPKEKWMVIGDRGSIIADWNQCTAANIDGKKKTIRRKPKGEDLHANFRAAVEGRAELLVTARQSLRTVRIFDAARRSAESRGHVAVQI